MSEGSAVLGPTEDDVTKLLMASAHIGTKNTETTMRPYIFKRKLDGTNIIDLHKTWEKMLLAARIIAAIENPKDVTPISGRPFGTRAVLKFANHVGARAIAGRYTPGTFTNQIQKAFFEPRLLIVTDPRVDHQPVREASYVNVPTIALANTDSPLRYIDVAIPCNNTGVNSIGLMWWFLAREVLRMRGTLTREVEWDIMVDLYFYRDPEDIEKEEQERLAKEAVTKDTFQQEAGFGQQWTDGTTAAAALPTAQAIAPAATEEWTAQATTTAAPAVAGFAQPVVAATEDWGAAGQAQEWSAGGGEAAQWQANK
jgi:small subunit ribosomal protein SAe